jgi:transcriptional regulator with XRE-family HTH domain
MHNTPIAETEKLPHCPETYRTARKSLGLSQDELAEMLEVSTATIANRESGRSAITREAWLAIQFMACAEIASDMLELS